MKKFLRPLYNAWMKFAHVLGWINTKILMTLFFIVIVGPYAVCIFIKKIVTRRKETESYWKSKDNTESTLDSLRNQF